VSPVPPSGSWRNPRDAGAKLGKLHEIQGVIQSLREPVETPDLTDAILSRVQVERPFTDPAERRWIWAGRASVAAGILLLLGAVVVLHAVAPKSTTWSGRAAPLSAVIDNAESEVCEGYQTIRAQLASVSNIVPSVEVPACQPATACSGGGCWAAPMLTVAGPTTGLADATSTNTGPRFVRLKAEFLHDRYLAATALESKPVAPPAPH
jgi:hypothetical protein